jgi:ribosomal protein S21
MVGFVEKKDERESFDAMFRRFTRNVVASQTLADAKARRFFTKDPNGRAQKLSALAKIRIRSQKEKALY